MERAQQQLYKLKHKGKERFSIFITKFETVLANAGWSVYANSQKNITYEELTI